MAPLEATPRQKTTCELDRSMLRKTAEPSPPRHKQAIGPLEVAVHGAHTDSAGSEKVPEGGAYAMSRGMAILRADGRGN